MEGEDHGSHLPVDHMFLTDAKNMTKSWVAFACGRSICAYGIISFRSSEVERDRLGGALRHGESPLQLVVD